MIDSFSSISGKNPTDSNNQKWIIKNLSKKISEDMKNIKNNIPIYHKVKAEDSCRDHSYDICSCLYADTDSIYDTLLDIDLTKYYDVKLNSEKHEERLIGDLVEDYGADDDKLSSKNVYDQKFTKSDLLKYRARKSESDFERDKTNYLR